jgi:hypothetical protein
MNVGKRLRVLEEKFRMHEINTFAGLGCVPSISTEQPCTLEEPTMNTIEIHKEVYKYENERHILKNALYRIRDKKIEEIKKHFNIDCERPQDLSPKELVDKIKNDKFKYKDDGEHCESREHYFGPLDGICLCDPDKEPRHEEYYTTRDRIDEDLEDFILDVQSLEPKEGRSSVKKYKEKKYH